MFILFYLLFIIGVLLIIDIHKQLQDSTENFKSTFNSILAKVTYRSKTGIKATDPLPGQIHISSDT